MGSANTINRRMAEAAEKYADRPALSVKSGKQWKTITYAELMRDVKAFSLGLRALGLERGDRVAVLSENRPEWAVADIAALAAGAHGISRTCGAALGQGTFQEVTIRNTGGYLSVYAIGELALLAVIGDSGLNIARLHLEARPVTARLAGLLQIRTIENSHPFG